MISLSTRPGLFGGNTVKPIRASGSRRGERILFVAKDFSDGIDTLQKAGIGADGVWEHIHTVDSLGGLQSGRIYVCESAFSREDWPFIRTALQKGRFTLVFVKVIEQWDLQ